MGRGPFQLPLFDWVAGLMGDPEPPVTRQRSGRQAPALDEVTTEGTGDEFSHPRANREALLGGRKVAYELRHSRRRSIGLAVGPDGLTITAPRRAGQGDIDRVLREKAHWIIEKLQRQRERGARMQAHRIEWRAGGEIVFLGRPLVLALDAGVTGVHLEGQPGTSDESEDRARRSPSGPDGQSAMAKPDSALRSDVTPGRLVIGLPPDASPAQLRDFVQGWLQAQARRIFEERCAVFGERLGVAPRRIALTSASTRWGSASAEGVVRLHWRLVQFDLPVIDYVVAHELAHLREMNHSARFWQVVASAMPDYDVRRRQLKEAVLPLWE